MVETKVHGPPTRIIGALHSHSGRRNEKSLVGEREIDYNYPRLNKESLKAKKMPKKAR